MYELITADDAAQLLAERAFISLELGGLVKQAEGWTDAVFGPHGTDMTPMGTYALRNAGIGALGGGLVGGLAGLLRRDRKSWMDRLVQGAARGAVTGGALGGGATLGYHGLRRVFEKPPEDREEQAKQELINEERARRVSNNEATPGERGTEALYQLREGDPEAAARAAFPGGVRGTAIGAGGGAATGLGLRALQRQLTRAGRIRQFVTQTGVQSAGQRLGNLATTAELEAAARSPSILGRLRELVTGRPAGMTSETARNIGGGAIRRSNFARHIPLIGPLTVAPTVIGGVAGSQWQGENRSVPVGPAAGK